MSSNESKLRQRSHGRLDRSRDPAILNAALAELSEHGYNKTNMNDIAARAGVGKAAIYRRWSSKAALMADVLVHWRPELLEEDIPDTGSLEGDFDVIVERAALKEDNLVSNDLVLRVALEATRDPDLGSAIDELLLYKGCRLVTVIIEQAVRRGDVPERDWSLVADTLVAMSLMRVVSGLTVDAAFLRTVIDTLILPALYAAEGAPASSGGGRPRH